MKRTLLALAVVLLWSATAHGAGRPRYVLPPEEFDHPFKGEVIVTVAQSDDEVRRLCPLGETDVTQWLLSQGSAELAEGVTDDSYVEAASSARRRKVGIWGDGPP